MAKKGYRGERDSLATVEVAGGRYWGAQTQRSLENSPIGAELMPDAMIHSFGLQKKAAALANMALGTLDARLPGDAAASFAARCVDGMKANEARVGELVEKSLMLVTALGPHIDHDKAAEIAKTARAKGQALREAALASAHVGAADFDRWVRPEPMTRPSPPPKKAKT